MNIKKWFGTIVVDSEDLLYTGRVLAGSEAKGEKRKEVIDAIKTALPKFYKVLALELVGAGRLKGEEGSLEFYTEINAGTDMLLLLLLPLYSANGRSWKFFDDQKATKNFERALDDAINGKAPIGEELEKKVISEIKTKYSRYADIILEARSTFPVHPFTKEVINSLFLAVIEALRVKVESAQ